MISKTIRQFYLLTGLLHLSISFTFATYVTFLISRGLNLFEVSFVNVAFFTTMFFAEVPTGAFADIYGRKKSFVLSCIIFSIGGIAYSQAHSLVGCMVAEIIAGVGRSFANGAFHAWLKDSLTHYGYAGKTEPIFRKEQLIKQIVSIPGALLGSYIGIYNIALPWFIGGMLGIVVALTAFVIMKEEYFVAGVTDKKLSDLWIKARTGAAFARKNSDVRHIIFLSTILLFCVQAPNMQWQPFFTKVLGGGVLLGMTWSIMMFGLIVGTLLSTFFLSKIRDERRTLQACLATIGIGLIATICTQRYAALSLFMYFLHEIPRGTFFPIKDSYLNDRIPEKIRATVISYQSAYGHFGSLAGLLITGAIAENYSISHAWLFSAIVLIGVAVVLTKITHKTRT